jgi:phage-related protein
MIHFFFPLVIGGILTDAFGKLFDVIWSVIKWIGRLLKKLFQGLIDLLVGFFEVIYALIDGLLYLLYKIGVLAVKLFLLFFELAKMIVSLFVGFAKTLASLVYIPKGGSGHGYSEMLGKIFSSMKPLQLDPIAYILLFILWMFTVVAAIKLLSSIRVGGD